MSTQKPTLSSIFMFCMENVHGLPDDMQDPKLAREAQQLFASPYMRVNTTTDVTGVEICGALKNVLAIAAGIVEGLDLGHNAMAALVAQVRQTLLAAEQNRKGKERKQQKRNEMKREEKRRKGKERKGKERKEKEITTPFGVNLMRSRISYRAAQVFLLHPFAAAAKHCIVWIARQPCTCIWTTRQLCTCAWTARQPCTHARQHEVGTQCGVSMQGCAEIRWLAEKMGAKSSTVSGLSGLGDIMLTCYGSLSRNR